MAWNVLIAHAPAEEVLADTFAKPIEQAGYTISYRGGVSVGESIELDAALALESGGPVVVCGTQLAVGSRWVGQLVNAARAKAGRPRVFVVQMEREAYVELLARDGVIAPYWEDPANAIRGLTGCGKSRDFGKTVMKRARNGNPGLIKSTGYEGAKGDESGWKHHRPTFSAAC